MNGYQKVERFQGWWNREVVLYKGEDIVMQGTIKQVAEWRGVRKDTIYWMTMPTAERRKAKFKDQSKVWRAVAV